MLVDVIEGIFVEEIRNRFLCSVRVEDQIYECYVPSSTRLSNFFDLKGVPVLLVKNEGRNTRTQYKLHAVLINDEWILVNLNLLNALFEEYYFQHNGGTEIFREKLIDNKYKADLYAVENEDEIIYEIKGVLSQENEPLFPAVIGERAEKQLSFFSRTLLKKKIKINYVIVLLSSSIAAVKLNRKEQKYLRLFRTCINRGMQVSFFKVICTRNEINLVEASTVIYK